jgi:hypothetical protein
LICRDGLSPQHFALEIVALRRAKPARAKSGGRCYVTLHTPKLLSGWIFLKIVADN